jgi:hypothetical protein
MIASAIDLLTCIMHRDLVIEPLADDLLYLLPSIIEGFNLGTKVSDY